MISRRDALKLGAAGLMAPAIGLGGRRHSVAMQEAQPGWAMPGGNPARTGVMTGSGPRFDLPLVGKWGWSGQYWSRPVVHSGILYHAPDMSTGLHAVEFETGVELWRTMVGQEIQHQVVDGDTLFVAADSEVLYAVDVATGQSRWQSRVVTTTNPASMIAVNNTLFCVGDSGSILALNSPDGTERWSSDARADSNSTISVDGSTVYVYGTGSTLYALDSASGIERWNLPIDTSSYPSGSNIIIADGTLYLRDYQGVVHAIDPETGTEHWRTPVGDQYEITAVHNGLVYGYIHNLGAFALDANSGQVAWSVSNEYALEVSGVVGDTLLVHGLADRSTPWRVFGLNAATGEQIWSFESFYRTYGPIVVGDHMFMYGLSGFVVGNPPMARLSEDVVIRGAPSSTGIERGVASAGSEIDSLGVRDTSSGPGWVEVTIGGVTGWIPLSAIDPATLPADNQIEDQRFIEVEYT